MEFRDRRGNYTILFVLTCSIMLSYLAFSIDGGRMQVAKLDGQNAAEAGALAALAAIRDGADIQEAEAAGAIAANKVSQTASSIASTPNAVAGDGQTFDVAIDWGRWNWEAERSTLDSRWDLRRDGTIPQAITVNVLSSGGIGTIFGSALGLASGNSADSKKFSSMKLGVGVRAAFRNRDIVVVVDTSRFTEGDIEGIQAGMQSFLDALVDNGIPGDNLAVVAYAGAGWNYDLRNPQELYDADVGQLTSSFSPHEPTSPFISVHRDHELARTTLGRVEPCNVGSDAFLHAYRFTNRGEDLELAAPYADYYAIETRPSNPNEEGQFYWPYDSDVNSIQGWYRQYWGNLGVNAVGAGNWGGSLDVATQCRVWFFVESLPFLGFDPRRDRLINAANGVRSPIQCHAGSPYEGRPDSVRRRVDRPIPSVTCGFDPVPENGEPRYNNPDNTPVMYEDRAYYAAGSNPAAGLNRAREILSDRLTNGEPTVILITNTFPRCGPNVLPSDIPDCNNTFLADTSAALEALDQDSAVTHVVAIAPVGSQSDVQLSTFTTGRGLYRRASRGDQVSAALADIARDLRVQVVR